MRCGMVFFEFMYLHFIVWFSYYTHLHLLRLIAMWFDAVFAVFLIVSVKLTLLDRRKSSQGWKYISRLNLWGSKGPSSWEHTKLGRGSIPDSPTRTFEKKIKMSQPFKSNVQIHTYLFVWLSHSTYINFDTFFLI